MINRKMDLRKPRLAGDGGLYAEAELAPNDSSVTEKAQIPAVWVDKNIDGYL
jgi:hypothetical protein